MAFHFANKSFLTKPAHKLPPMSMGCWRIEDLKQKAKLTHLLNFFKKFLTMQMSSTSKLSGASSSPFRWDFSQLVINRLKLFYLNSEAELSSMETLSKHTHILHFPHFSYHSEPKLAKSSTSAEIIQDKYKKYISSLKVCLTIKRCFLTPKVELSLRALPKWNFKMP